MRELRVVAVSDDGKLVLGTGKEDKASYELPVDERLKAALRGQLQQRPPERSTSALTPREIQARLRAGSSPEEVARAAGVNPARIEGLIGPILAERGLVVEQAQAATMSRQRRGASARTLGESVHANLARASGLRPETVDWTAWRDDSGTWVVRLTFIARARRRVAQWAWDPSTHSVIALDNVAAALGYVDEVTAARAPIIVARRPIATVPVPSAQVTATPVEEEEDLAPAPVPITRPRRRPRRTVAKRPAARKAGRKRAAPKRTAAKRSTPKRTTAKRTTAKRTSAKRSTAKRGTARRTVKRPAAKRPAVKRVTKRAAPSRPATKRAAPTRKKVSRPVAKKTARPVAKKVVPRKPAAVRPAPKKVAPPLKKKAPPRPVAKKAPPPVKRAAVPTRKAAAVKKAPAKQVRPVRDTAPPKPRTASEAKSGVRRPLPSWADILLGVATEAPAEVAKSNGGTSARTASRT